MKKYFLALLIIFLSSAAGCEKEVQVNYYPPPGQLYDIGGYRLHLRSIGSGSPAVIMESGAADFSLTWALVAPEIAQSNKVCTYDRAGFGWSEVSPYPRLATIEVEELHSLLQEAGISPPYVFVGHSMGGVLSRLFAHTYPNEVVGLILVDPGHEEQKTRQDADVQASMDAAVSPALAKLSDFAELAEKRRLTEADIKSFINPKLPLREQLEYSYIYLNKPSHWRSVVSESSNIDISYAQIKNENIFSLGNIPLIVISSSEIMGLAATPELSAKADKVMRQLQQEISEQSTLGTRIIANGTSHYIQLDRPQVVIDAIRSVLKGMSY